MSRADYAHWNEDADYMWWHEEGRHVEEPPEPDDDWRHYDPDALADHDDSGDECIAQGDMSTHGNGVWVCDACEGDLLFTRDAGGKFKPEGEQRWMT